MKNFRRSSFYNHGALARPLMRPLPAAVMAALGLLAMNSAVAGGPLPAPGVRIPLTALPSGPSTQVVGTVSGRQIFAPQVVAGTFNPYQVAANPDGTVSGTITQNGPAGILRWSSFDIGAAARVTVVQPSATAVLLNKVDSGAYLNKTVIEGMLKGNGQVYIYNPNGIVFGKTSVVDVNTLVASSLKIDETRFMNGILAPSISPIMTVDSTLGFRPGDIAVEGESGAGAAAQQAQIKAASGGRILLAAPNISNNGVLSAPDGQVALAAGGSVFLASPTDARMRGLFVEVNTANVGSTSSVTNDTLGQINVGRGNATMVGYAVNQMGIVSATTSTSLNGSVFLHAQDGASKTSATGAATATRGGNLVLGENSVTQVLPDASDTATGLASSFQKSWVDLTGNSIHLLANSSVKAPGGIATVAAQGSPSAKSPNGASQLYLEPGSSIDVSGSTTAVLPMESNVISVQLRGVELADSPLQRNSVEYGKNVNIDIRKGTTLGNVSGYLNLVEQSVEQLTAAGGSVSLYSDGTLIQAPGSVVNVSGGSVTFNSGYVATTQLTSGGLVYDISTASPNRIYDGFFTSAPGPRNFEAGYTDGKSAGSLNIAAPNMLLRGQLLGSATPGTRQRDVTSTSYPKGGEILIGYSRGGVSTAAAESGSFEYRGVIDFGGTSTAATPTPAFNDAQNPVFSNALDVGGLAGFSRTRAFTQGNIVVEPGFTFTGAAGDVALVAGNSVAINGSIRMPGGNIRAEAATSLTVGQNAVLDVAGLWTNDRSTPAPASDAQGNPTGAIVTAGGSVSLSGQTVAAGDGAYFDVSGGAWQNTAGKIIGGSGGAITLNATGLGQAAPLTAQLTLGNNLQFRGYGISTGGKLALSGRNIVIGANAAAPDLSFAAGFFQQGGFSSYSLLASGNLTIASGTAVAPRMDNWLTNSATSSRASGQMSDAFSIGTMPLAGPLGSRNAASISLKAVSEINDGFGRLWLQPGASIVADPGATVTLSAGRQMTVDGSVVAHGGTINLNLSPAVDANLIYRPERSVWLGSNSLLDVSGDASRVWTTNLGVSNGELLNGGSINIGRQSGGANTALPGYVVMQPGATLDASGVQSTMTLSSERGGLTSTTVASSGGSIDIRTREGLLIAGTMKGAGGNAGAAGGSVTLAVDRENIAGSSDFPQAPRNLIVDTVPPPGGIVPPSLQPDQPITGREATGHVLAGTLNNGGFDSVKLKSQDVLTFDLSGGNATLTARNALALDAPVISTANAAAGSTVTLNAFDAVVGNSDWRYQVAGAAAVASGGNATLNVNANTIDLIGSSALQNFAGASFVASGDVRLNGALAVDVSAAPTSNTLPVITSNGSFSSAGPLSFSSAQLYPTTLSNFTLNATGGTASFTGNGANAEEPLAAAGTLTVNASDIVQNGVLRAPFGNITLSAINSLSYGNGSLTSVAGRQAIPLGRTSNGLDWLYDFGNGNTVAINNATATNGVMLPQKIITSTAKSVTLGAGARLDLSGGGELYAYEFTPGPGGSSDVLAKPASASTPTTFAILPGYSNSVAPADYQYGSDGGLKVGDRVYLSGMPGLAAGYYTLLPSHYALLTGAFAVSPVSGKRDMSPVANSANADGSWLIAGKRATAISTESRTSGFQVWTSAQIRNRSEFTDSFANTFFTGGNLTLPRDGGHVVFAATQNLALAGGVNLNAGKGGLGGIADVSASDLTVTATAAQSTGTSVAVLASDLDALGADSLMIGGVRSYQPDGVRVTTTAQKVTLSNDSAHVLAAPEVILTATDTVLLNSGSAIADSGAPGRAPANLTMAGTGPGADGALLRVSGGGLVSVGRNSPAGMTGTLDIEAGATVKAAGSFNFDATKSLILNSQPVFGTGAAGNFGANRISFGDASPVIANALRFDSAALAQLSGLSNVTLTSRTTLDMYGGFSIGNASQDLTLAGAGVQFYGNAGDVVNVTANSLRFEGGGAFNLVTPAPATPTGSFVVNARDIKVGSNAFAVNGFDNVMLTATREVRADGSGGALSAQKDMTITAGRITASSAKDAAVSAGNSLVLAQVISPEAGNSQPAFGGKLAFTANSITSNALVSAQSGAISMTAGQSLKVTGGTVDASGASEVFGSTTLYAPAGQITLTGASVQVDAGSTLDVSATNAAAGTLSVKAVSQGAGTMILNGTLKGGSSGTQNTSVSTQGVFVADVDQIGQFGGLNQQLNTAGFAGKRDFRVRTGNVVLNAGESITARDVVISADNGNITVGGAIDASGAQGGSIQLYASQPTAAGGSGNVNLLAGAQLMAQATVSASSAAGSAGDGGRVVIGTSSADGLAPVIAVGSSINVGTGAPVIINVSGSGAGQNGRVLFRAPRVGSGGGTDVAIRGLGNVAVTGSQETVVEGNKVYTATTISGNADSGTNLSAATTGKMFTESNSFIANSSSITTNTGAQAGMVVRPGVEVRSTGNLTVSVNETGTANSRGWNLNTWRFNSQPGELTLRAAGDLTINGSISDGFVRSTTATVSMPDWKLDQTGGASWSYGLVGGANLSAANPLGVNPGTAAGDVTIGFARTSGSTTDQPVAMVRTGSGRIDVAAGRDVTLARLASPGLTDSFGPIPAGAVIYTAGVHTDVQSGFPAPASQTLNAAYGSTAATAAEFATGGGGISIAASRNVTGAATSQLVNNWLFRQGRTTTAADGSTIFVTSGGAPRPTAWWNRPEYFNQGVATFAGGNISVTAGSNVSDLSLSAATNGQVLADASQHPQQLVEQGGGDITVRAGGNILGGTTYVQNGRLVENAGGSIGASSRVVQDASSGSNVPLRPVIALGNGAVALTASGSLEIESVINPTMTRQSTVNAARLAATTPAQYGYFSTYDPASSVSLLSLGGNILLSNNAQVLANAGGQVISTGLSGSEANYINMFLQYPPTLNVGAMSGNISLQHGFTLAPAAQGQLQLLAYGSVQSAFLKNSSGGLYGNVQPVVMLDSTTSVPGVLSPRTLNAGDFGILTGLGYESVSSAGNEGLAFHTLGGLHAADTQPARIVALTGDITGESYFGNEAAGISDTLVIPKSAELIAGRDIVNFGFKVQQLKSSDVTIVQAGRDIVDSTNVAVSSPVRHIVQGPGRVDVSAGRNIDFGNGSGLVTRGNLDNPYLTDGGAGIHMEAGAKADYASFFQRFVSLNDLPADAQSSLVTFMRQAQPSLPADVDAATAFAAFVGLPVSQQQHFLNAQKPLLDSLFFNKLAIVTGAKADSASGSFQTLDLNKFDDVIGSLYPSGSITAGNVNVFGSQLKTEQGGSIGIFAPGGSVLAGLLNVPRYLSSKPASSLGIFTVRGGELGSLVKSDFLVNQGRVFTLGGGDITLVSQYGNIDAGRGAKTAVSAPPPLLKTDANGNTVIDISGSISGSGIATLQTSSLVAPSNVYPIAPRGIFDAGDAGVRSSGSVSIVAAQVLNASNITAAGSVSGSQTAATAVAAPVAAPVSATTQKTDSYVPNTANTASTETMNLSVELLGVGDDDNDRVKSP